MPRKRPDVMRGLSGRLVADLDRLERSRNYLWHGEVKRALEDWAAYQRSPARRLWLDDPPVMCSCDVDPAHLRELLGHVADALPSKSGRELRKRLQELDAA
ncbi:hypothetical protein [Lentzea sp. NPDC051838]|uniref:hypothetical protein n=1 Tax=Lentzea sp. NPDC051838 TaxID=3154849 RepID=UPI00341A38EC